MAIKTKNLYRLRALPNPQNLHWEPPPKQSPPRLDLTLERAEENAFQEKDITLKAGDTLTGVLLEAGISRQEADASSTAMGKVFDPRDLRAGQMIKLIIRNETDSKDNQCLERIEFVPETGRDAPGEQSGP